MSENIREKYDNFFKSINEYNIDQKMNNIFNNIISELEGVETTISVLSKLITISRLDDMSREICHYKQHGLLYKNDVEGYDGLYTYLDYNDNSVQMFDFLLDKDGNTKEISIDFLNELGKFEHMQINYNNKKLDKVRVIFNVDNKGKKAGNDSREKEN